MADTICALRRLAGPMCALAIVAAVLGSGEAVAWTCLGGGDHGGLDFNPATECSSGVVAGVHTNVRAFRVASGATVTVRDWDGVNYGYFEVRCQSADIAGTLSAVGAGFLGPRDVTSGLTTCNPGPAGEGPGGGAGGQYYKGDSTGGGGASYGGAGGVGGSCGCSGGASGATYGAAGGLSIEKGSGGGGTRASSNTSAKGGDGGGAIFIDCAGAVTVTGTLSVDGDDGVGGGEGGGGGGSGGGILIRGAAVTLSGSLSARGGAGGVSTDTSAASGGGGGGGRIKIFYSSLSNTASVALAGGAGTTAGCGSSRSGSSGVLYLNGVPATPINTSPGAGVYVATLTPTLTSSYVDANGDPVAAAQFRLRSSAGYGGAGSFDSGQLGAVTSWQTPILADNTTYYWQARFSDGLAGYSAYSTETAFTVDVSAPLAGVVNDGSTGGVDIDSQTSTSSLSANWSGFSDPGSGIASYEWAIGSSPGATDVQSWTNVGTSTSATNAALGLSSGTTYYISVRARNGAGAVGAPVSSDGVRVVGGSCTSASQCASGFCVDGVCCDSACGGGSGADCQACSIAAGGATNGFCGVVSAGWVCRGSAGACDAAETCTGSSTSCPGDGLQPAGTVCRAAAGVCDRAETCSGTSADCPADGLEAAGTQCRAAVDLCDEVETCTGSSVACPADAFKPAGTVCRGPSEACDDSETCTGSSVVCPPETTGSSPDVTNLVAVAGVQRVSLVWTNPSQHEGVLILRAVGASPNTAPTAGASYSLNQAIGNATVVYVDSCGSGVSSFDDTGLTNGTRYYYKVYNHQQKHTYSSGNVPTSSGVFAEPTSRTGGAPLWCYSVGLPSVQQPVTQLGTTVFTSSNGGAVTANVTDTSNTDGDGRERWRPVQLSGAVQSRFPLVTLRGRTGKQGLVGDQSGRVYAVDMANGSLLWTANGGAPLGDRVQAFVGFQSFATANAAFQAAHPNRDLVFAATRNSSTTSNKVYALSGVDGSVVWTFAPGNMDIVSGGLVTDNSTNRLFVASRANGGTQPSVWVLSTLDGSLVKTFSLGDSDASVGKDPFNNQVYITTNAGAVHGIDLATLNVVWSQTVGPMSSYAFVTGNGFIASLKSGAVERYMVVGTTVTRSWTTPVANPSGVTVDYSTQKLFVGSSDGKVHQLDVKTGVDEKQFVVSSQAIGMPTIDTVASRLHVGTLDGRLCAIPLPLP